MKARWITLLILFSCAVVLLGLSGCSESETELQPVAATPVQGQSAPDFTLTDMQGAKVSLSGLRGKVVILNFWATWCPPCREEMPSMEKLHQQFNDQGLVILAVNVEKDAAALKNFLQQNGYSFPVLQDKKSEVQNLYKVFRFPESFIIDRNGQVVQKVIGAIDWTSGPVIKLIKFMLEAK